MSSISSGAGPEARTVERPSLEYERAVSEARRLREAHQTPSAGDRIPPEVWAEVDFAALLVESRPEPSPVGELHPPRVAELLADTPPPAGPSAPGGFEARA